MNETDFFNGRLRKKSLPVYQGGAAAAAEGPKRLALPQGELANVYNDEEGIKYLALVELRVGGIRGNHRHRVKLEHVYVISGRVLLVAEDRGERVEVKLEPGDLVRIETGVAHAMKPLEGGYAVEFSPALFDAKDVERVKLI